MKRQLNKEERVLTEKGVKRMQNEIRELQDNLAYNLSLLEKQNYIREFDDRWRKYLREGKTKEDDKVIKQMEIFIKEKIETVAKLHLQLKEGVEKSTAIG